MRATESPGIAGPASSPPRAAEPDPEHGAGGEDGGAEGDQRAGAPGGDRTSPGASMRRPRRAGRRAPCTRGRRERRVLDEDAPLQVLERSPRLDAQLVGEGPAAGGVALERLGLAAAAVQREHELAAEPLAQRMLVDERLELADELGALPEPEVGLDALLQAGEAPLLQPGDLSLGPLLVGEVGERRAAPEGEGLAQRRGRAGRVAGRQRRAPGRRQLLEAVEVEPPGRDVQEVARGRGSRSRRRRRRRPAAPAAAARCRPGRPGARSAGATPPRVGDQPLGRDHRVRAQQEERQQGSLPEPSERDARSPSRTSSGPRIRNVADMTARDRTPSRADRDSGRGGAARPARVWRLFGARLAAL